MAESPHCVLEPELDGQDESVRGRTAGIVVITPTELASETELDVSRIPYDFRSVVKSYAMISHTGCCEIIYHDFTAYDLMSRSYYFHMTRLS